MHRKPTGKVLWALALAVALGTVVQMATSCGGGGSGDPCGADAIKVGTVHPQTGELGIDGPAFDSAIDMAAEEINAAGGVLGRRLCVVHEDSATDPARARTRTEKLLTQDRAIGIIGADTSSESIEMLKTTGPAQVPQISCCSTSVALSMQDNFFRSAPSDALQTVVLARRAHSKGYATVSTIYVADVYGQGLSAAFKEEYEDSGHKVVFSGAYSEGQSSYRSVVEQALQPAPAAILLVAFNKDAITIVNDAKVLGFKGKWMFSDGITARDFITNIGAAKDAIEGAEGTTPGPSPEADDQARGAAFAAAYKAYRQKKGLTIGDNSYSANAYDALYLMATAIERAGGTGGSSVVARVVEISGPPGTEFGPGEWAKARTTLAGGGKVNYQGASGKVDLDANGDPPGYYIVWTVEGGQYKELGTEKP
jgi:ABC-type branched-subunit amino acid transport system substrate-binding protein